LAQESAGPLSLPPSLLLNPKPKNISNVISPRCSSWRAAAANVEAKLWTGL